MSCKRCENIDAVDRVIGGYLATLCNECNNGFLELIYESILSVRDLKLKAQYECLRDRAVAGLEPCTAEYENLFLDRLSLEREIYFCAKHYVEDGDGS